MKWTFIRHGQIGANLNKIYAGRSEEPLTETGIEQAHTVGNLLQGTDFDVLVCSPLMRTKQTAEILGKYINLIPLANESFIEMAFGPWEGKSEGDIEQTYPDEWRIWNTQPHLLRLPGRETLEQLQARVLAGMTSIRDSGVYDSVLVVTHVAIIRVISLFSEGRPLSEYKKVIVDNCGYFTFENIELA